MTQDDIAPLLGGEANPNSWYFGMVGQVGPLGNPSGHTFSLITHDQDQRWRIVGTGFYVTGNGLFVTARHVIDEVFSAGKQVAPLLIVHPHSEVGPFGPSEWLLRPIMQCWLADGADIAFGAAATTTNQMTGEILSNWTWIMSWSVPPVGAPVATYAFPGKFRSNDDGQSFMLRADLYAGHLLSAADFRDTVMMPFPYLQVNFRMHGATSGGPIIAKGRIIGVNCTEYETQDLPPGPAFGTQIRCLRDAFLDDVIALGEVLPRRVSFDEFVRTGSISVDDYTPKTGSELFPGSVVRLDMPHTARPPKVGFVIYS